jgi:hypothetical protein
VAESSASMRGMALAGVALLLFLAACGLFNPTLPAGTPTGAAPTPDPALTPTPSPTLPITRPPAASPTPPSPFLTPPAQTSDGAFQPEYIEEHPSPDGQWLARYTYTHLEGGGQHVLLEILRGEEDAWIPALTLWDKTESGLGSSQPVLKGWDAESRYFYFTSQPTGYSCALFDSLDSSWTRVSPLTGQVDELALPSGYEHTLSPSGSQIAYIVREPELALGVYYLLSDSTKLIPLPAEEVGDGTASAGGLVWAPDEGRVILTIAAGDFCEGEPRFALARVNLFSGRVTLHEPSSRAVSAVTWDRSEKILLRDSEGWSWWISASSGEMTRAAPPVAGPPTPTPLPPSQAERVEILRQQEPVVVERAESPDGQWTAEVRRWECRPFAEYEENALEELILTRRGEAERQVEEQFINCGGIGTWGLGDLRWTADSRYLYYTVEREGVPGGYGSCLGWDRSRFRLEVMSGERESLTYGVLAPDGERWAMRQEGELVIWSFEGGEESRISAPEERRLFFVVEWMPDGRSLVYSLASEQCMPFGPISLWRLDLESGRSTRLVEDAPSLEFSIVQGGEALIFTTADSVGEDTPNYLHGLKLFHLDLLSGQKRLLAEASDTLFYRLGREGREAVLLLQDATPEHPRGVISLRYLNLDSGLDRLLAQTEGYIDFYLSAGTGRLAYLEREHRGGYAAGAYQLMLVDLDSFSQETLVEGWGTAELILSPDGLWGALHEVEWEGERRVASTVSLVDLVDGSVSRVIEGHRPPFDYIWWEDEENLSLGWGGMRFHIPTGEIEGK